MHPLDINTNTLLVIPSDDLRGMLDEQPCGLRPPIAHISDRGWTEGPCAEQAPARSALVLRWDGRDRPHGWLCASRLLSDMAGHVHRSNKPRLIAALRGAGCTIIAREKRVR